jgi:hypothetical protein
LGSYDDGSTVIMLPIEDRCPETPGGPGWSAAENEAGRTGVVSCCHDPGDGRMAATMLAEEDVLPR